MRQPRLWGICGLLASTWLVATNPGCCHRCLKPLWPEWNGETSSPVQQASYRHPELHPVPTHPALMPRGYAAALAGSLSNGPGASQVTRPGEQLVPQIEMFPPPAPDESSTEKPPSSGRDSKQGNVKDRLTIAQPKSGSDQATPWIFPSNEWRRPPQPPMSRTLPSVAERPARESLMR